jgi:hypothetical protein
MEGPELAWTCPKCGHWLIPESYLLNPSEEWKEVVKVIVKERQ